MQIIKTTLVVFIFLAITIPAHAAGISVTPSRIDEHVEAHTQKDASITIYNPTNEVLIVEVYPDEFSEMIKIAPESLTLESHEESKVVIQIDAQQPGRFATSISVVAKPLADRSLQTAAGIKVPLSVSVEAAVRQPVNVWLWAIIGIDTVLALVLIVLIVRRVRRQKQARGGKREGSAKKQN